MEKITQPVNKERLGSIDSTKSEEEATHNIKSDSITLDSATNAKLESEQESTFSSSDNKLLTQSNNSKSTSGIEKSLPSSQILEEVFDEHSEPTNAGNINSSRIYLKCNLNLNYIYCYPIWPNFYM